MEQLTKKDSGIIYLLALLVPQIVGGIILSIYCLFFENQSMALQTQLYIYLSGLIPQICFCAIFFGFTKVKKYKPYQSLGLNKKPTVKTSVLIVIIAIILFVSLYYFVDLFDKLLALIGIPINNYIVNVPNDNLGLFIANIFVFALFPAIFEELIYRGLIFTGLKELGKWTAIVLSAIMFAVMHLSPLQLVYPMIMGIIFAIIFDKTKCIYYTMLFHFSNNFLVLIVDYFDGLFIFNQSYNLTFLPILAIIIGAIVGVSLVLLLIKKCINADNDTNLQVNANQQNSTYLYISFIVAIVFWLLALITKLKG